MPTLVWIGAIAVRIFARDHPPPHVHIWTPQGDMKVALSDLSIIQGKIRKHDYELAMAWIRGNIGFLRSEWDRLNG